MSTLFFMLNFYDPLRYNFTEHIQIQPRGINSIANHAGIQLLFIIEPNHDFHIVFSLEFNLRPYFRF